MSSVSTQLRSGPPLQLSRSNVLHRMPADAATTQYNTLPSSASMPSSLSDAEVMCQSTADEGRQKLRATDRQSSNGNVGRHADNVTISLSCSQSTAVSYQHTSDDVQASCAHQTDRTMPAMKHDVDVVVSECDTSSAAVDVRTNNSTDVETSLSCQLQHRNSSGVFDSISASATVDAGAGIERASVSDSVVDDNELIRNPVDETPPQTDDVTISEQCLPHSTDYDVSDVNSAPEELHGMENEATTEDRSSSCGMTVALDVAKEPILCAAATAVAKPSSPVDNVESDATCLHEEVSPSHCLSADEVGSEVAVADDIGQVLSHSADGRHCFSEGVETELSANLSVDVYSSELQSDKAVESCDVSLVSAADVHQLSLALLVDASSDQQDATSSSDDSEQLCFAGAASAVIDRSAITDNAFRRCDLPARGIMLSRIAEENPVALAAVGEDLDRTHQLDVAPHSSTTSSE